MNTKSIGRFAALAGMSLGLVVCAAMGGCQTSYAADIRNTTPQPVYAQLMERFDEGSTVRSSVRIDPGSRAGMGPVIAREGRAYLVVDTIPNPGTPVTVPLAVGTTVLEVIQRGEAISGPLEIRIIGGNPPEQPVVPPPPTPGH